MKRMNMRFLYGTLVMAVFTFTMSSCLMNDDLMTADAKTGGLTEAVSLVQLVPRSSDYVEVDIKIYKGPAIKSLKVYKQFFHNATGQVSDFVLLGTIPINGENVTDTLILTKSFTWAQLKQGVSLDGYSLPDDPLNADVGDYFMLKYVSVLDDGREVTSSSQTEVLVGNSYSGYYLADITFFHPNFGAYPNNPYRYIQTKKELITIDGSSCYTTFALWGAYGETIYITVNPDNSITFNVFGFDYIVQEGDPNNLLAYSHYDPLTGSIYLYYHYAGPGGNRIFWETLEPIQ